MFVELDAEKALRQRTQTEFADPKQSRRNDCVEDFARREIQATPEHAQIVIGGVIVVAVLLDTMLKKR